MNTKISCNVFFFAGWCSIYICTWSIETSSEIAKFQAGFEPHFVVSDTGGQSQSSAIQPNDGIDQSYGSTVGCMAASCHGSKVLESPIWQKSGSIWFEKDPHAVAYIRLLNEQSLAMINRLLGTDYKGVDSEGFIDALAQRCVSCHSNTFASVSDRVLGIDCQVCHGPASSWGPVHYSSDWHAMGENRYKLSNMRNTSSLASLAKICSSCHVGELNSEFGDREVTHDLMAAGHPPMHFDLVTYLSRYPKHWDEAIEDAVTNRSSFQVWRIGKLVTAISRLRLLADRAKEVRIEKNTEVLGRNDYNLSTKVKTPEVNGRTWPEFSEYSCYKCHHAIQENVIIPVHGGRSTSSWDSWTITELQSAVQSENLNDLQFLVTNLENTLESTSPDPSQSITAAESLLNLLESELTKVESSGPLSEVEMRQDLKVLVQRFPGDTAWEKIVPWFLVTRSLVKDLQLNVPYQVLLDAEKQLGFPSLPGSTVRMEGPLRLDSTCLDTYRNAILDSLKN